uniref:Uncharacterized protein n=1 Tax=Oryza punctata TaxID=4537 RepID=A0A0E0LNC5_ORYPU
MDAGSGSLSRSSRCSDERSRASVCCVPELKCACGRPAVPGKSTTEKNPGRRWLHCGGEVRRYYLWIWEDLLNEYVEEMVAYCHTGKYDSLRETCDTLRWQLVDEKA